MHAKCTMCSQTIDSNRFPALLTIHLRVQTRREVRRSLTVTLIDHPTLHALAKPQTTISWQFRNRKRGDFCIQHPFLMLFPLRASLALAFMHAKDSWYLQSIYRSYARNRWPYPTSEEPFSLSRSASALASILPPIPVSVFCRL